MEPVRQCAAVILTDKQNRMLLWQPRQSYGLPGGVVEPGETPPQAAVREAEEEIGVVVALEYLVGSYHLRGGGKVDNFEFIYKARIVSGKPRIADPNEVLRLEWFEPDKLPHPGLMLNVMRVAIPDFWTGERGVIRHVQRL